MTNGQETIVQAWIHAGRETQWKAETNVEFCVAGWRSCFRDTLVDYSASTDILPDKDNVRVYPYP